MTPGGLERFADALVSPRHAEQQVLGGDVLVLELLGLVLGPVDAPSGTAATGSCSAALDLGELVQLLVDPAREEHVGSAPMRCRSGGDDAVLLVEQGPGEVLGLDGLVVLAARERLGLGDGLLGLDGELVELHAYKLTQELALSNPNPRVRRRRYGVPELLASP